MSINLTNYEAYIIDYVEGNLSKDQQNQLMAFLAIHPELKQDLADFEQTVLVPDESIVYGNKAQLKQKAGLVVWWRHPGLLAVAAAAAILIFFIFNNNSTETGQPEHPSSTPIAAHLTKQQDTFETCRDTPVNAIASPNLQEPEKNKVKSNPKQQQTIPVGLDIPPHNPITQNQKPADHGQGNKEPALKETPKDPIAQIPTLAPQSKVTPKIPQPSNKDYQPSQINPGPENTRMALANTKNDPVPVEVTIIMDHPQSTGSNSGKTNKRKKPAVLGFLNQVKQFKSITL